MKVHQVKIDACLLTTGPLLKVLDYSGWYGKSCKVLVFPPG